MIYVISTYMSLDKIYHMGTNNSNAWGRKFNPTFLEGKPE